jgi:hypothetical protein
LVAWWDFAFKQYWPKILSIRDAEEEIAKIKAIILFFPKLAYFLSYFSQKFKYLFIICIFLNSDTIMLINI